MNCESKSQHNYLIDYLKAICIIFVIVTHCGWFTDHEYYQYTASGIKHPLMIFVVDMAVPIFLMLSAYTHSISYEKNKAHYYKYYVPRKMLEYSIPMLAVVARYWFLHRGNIDLGSAIAFGQFGTGAYYYVVLLKMLVFFPIIYLIVDRGKNGVLITVIIQLFFELIFLHFGLDISYYRVALGRYIIFVAMGIYHYKNRKLPQSMMAICFTLGIIWLLSYNYFGYTPKLFRWWTWSSLPTIMYIFPFVYWILGINALNNCSNEIERIFAYIGQKTWFIFAFQMLYFSFPVNTLLQTKFGMARIVVINCIACLGGGIVYSFVCGFVLRCMKSKRSSMEEKT